MARLIRELIFSNNLLLFLLGAAGLIITLLLFQFASQRKWGLAFEKWFAIFYVFISPHVNVPPFNYLHFINLAEEGGTISKLPYVFYPWVIFILCGRLISFFKHQFVEVLLFVAIRNPCFLLYCFMPVISALWSLVPDVTLRAGMAFTGFTIFGFYIGARYEWTELSGLLRWGYTAIGIVSVLRKPNIGSEFAGITSHKNSLGSIMVLSTALWYLHYSQTAKTQKERWMCLVLMLFSFYLVRATSSGGSLVNSLMLIVLVSSLNFLSKLKFQWSFTFLVGFMVLGTIGSIYVVENLESIVVGGLGKDLTLTGRTEFWPQLIAAANQRPWFGYGFEGFFQQDTIGAQTPAHFIYTSIGFQPRTAHNGPISVLLSFGYPGLAMLLISLFTNLLFAVRELSRRPLAESGIAIIYLVFIILNNMTEGSIGDIGDVWLAYVLLTVRLSTDSAKSSSSNNRSYDRQLGSPLHPD
ncbi:MAG: O-antigen ligase family protein [Oscillatoriales cyanobacterium RU_3_3]|nr:O-antigen ligase family protein [Microcoleus sp. SU_5_6]NJM62602.1 O-antigen ligase family protein [Oscillatoriales cyanobacterium RU_3_3]NJR20857.1 O-antigen ligase family protein [Richelia sp. CSU_2_1]